ncbi:Hsp20/alpha crystallin family protein [Parasporobacterium paucivorans]|uniref:Heat shock protein Hsp20 n=1 Tax=Parasporobacterium paucivorans DSM 15970 TaxID=1122934 RepID=A0A1M6HLF1_9FIRM|nr:Hsp20/alpha crystallin family protein [Parasporobacterium paucivorans]SHJ23000.1 heat shock protein Hsp20 [Parasporobacterium paucivorans DSM 15970]
MLVPSIFDKDFVDDLFDNAFSFPTRFKKSRLVTMNTDVREADGKYLIDIEIPGYAKDEIKAEVKNGYLIVKADHKEEKEEKDEAKNYLRRERYSGHSERSFYVGHELKQEDIKATFKDGILKLEVPKTEKKAEVEEKKFIPIE